VKGHHESKQIYFIHSQTNFKQLTPKPCHLLVFALVCRAGTLCPIIMGQRVNRGNKNMYPEKAFKTEFNNHHTAWQKLQ